MKNLERRVQLLCPMCGNTQFTSSDEEEDCLHTSSSAQIRCFKCGFECTKQELLDSNAEIIDNAVHELKTAAIGELQKAVKKWRL